MSIVAYEAIQSTAAVTLTSNNQTVIVRLGVPNTGSFVVFGRVVVQNSDATPRVIQILLTTLDGATTLDTVAVLIPGEGTNVSVSLHGVLVLPAPNMNEIVDIRCITFNGLALSGKVWAISVDSISNSTLS